MSVLVISNQIKLAVGISVQLPTNKLVSFKNMKCRFRIKNAAYDACKSRLRGNYLATFSVQVTVLASKLPHFKDFYWEHFRTEERPAMTQLVF